MKSAIAELTRLRGLLQLEYDEEKASFTRITDNIGVTRLVEHGYAWWPIEIGRQYFNSINQRVVEIINNSSDDSEHSFEPGRTVQFFLSGKYTTRQPERTLQGQISYVDGTHMIIIIPDSADLTRLSDSERQAGVMLSFDETSYRAMFDAIDSTIGATGRHGELRDILFSPNPVGRLTFDDISLPYLNPSQNIGVNNVLHAKDIAIVHGPPGTGKTTTLVEAIYETLKRESQVMVCAQSNMAVDWISEKLVDRGISVMRLGNPSRVNDKMLSFTYERRFESHPDYPTLWSIRKAMRELHAARRNSDQWHQKMNRLKNRAAELEIRINAELLDSSKVIASTLVGSNHRLLTGLRFSTLFIDEAAQALEAACWIPARRAGRIILAGDHCQLPATVKSYKAARQGLGVSMMERVAKLHPEAVTLLEVQYRMNQTIMEFLSRWFYDSKMKAAPEVKHRGILDLDTPMEWIDTSAIIPAQNPTDKNVHPTAEVPFRELIRGKGYGRVNYDEARLTVDTLHDYINRIGCERILDERIDIGLISPYRAQVAVLRRMIRHDNFFRPFRNLISINTVDGFQGQERDVIIISLVRSNDRGQIGFLNDLRRMNVAITRARMKVILVGDVSTLNHTPFYRALHDYILTL